MIDNSIKRINKVLIDNKYIDINKIETIVASDIIYLFNNYFVFKKDMLDVKINTLDDCYELNLKVKIDRIKNIAILPNSYF